MKSWQHKSVKELIRIYPEFVDPVEIIQNLAREKVLEGFNHRWQGPPYDPIRLAEILGIQVNPSQEVIDARVSPVGKDSFRIEYNPMTSRNRISFSIAHEIGHTLFPDCAEKVRNREAKDTIKKDNEWELEFLCNVAAAEILLPYAEFSREANSVPLNLESIQNLATRYRASIEAVFLRFCDVVTKECAMAIAAYDTKGILNVDYAKSSNVSSLVIRRGMIVPTNSSAYEVNKIGWTSRRLEEWTEFGGTRYNVEAVGLSPLPGEYLPRVGLFFVPEFYEVKQSTLINTRQGDATNPIGSGVKIIAQVVNSQAGLGKGFGYALAKRHPEVRSSIKNWQRDKTNWRIGATRIVNLGSELLVFQMLAQEGISSKHGLTPLRYSALRQGLKELARVAIARGASIHMPAIGAGQAGGNWDIIEGMIHQELVQLGVDVTVYLLPGRNTAPKRGHNTLSLFDEQSLNDE